MKKIGNKGFSLVELLAAVTIMGILMAISIPMVSLRIDNTKRDAYLNTVRIQKNSIQRIITEDQYYVFDENTVYYFDYRLGNEDEASHSPFGDWINAYVVVTYDGKENQYYWTGIDEMGWKIDLARKVENMTRKDIYLVDNPRAIVPGQEVEGKDNIVIYKYDDAGNVGEEEHEASNDVTKLEADRCFTVQELGDNSYAIIDYNTACGTIVRVPSSIDGMPVTIIGENAFRNKGLTEVTLFYGIVELKNGAFQNNNITSLKLSSSITTIGPHAFYQNKIPKVTFPEGLETIGGWAFANNRLTEVIFPRSLKTIGEYAFYGNLLSDIELHSNPSISGAAFSNNKMPPSKGIIYKYDATTGQTDYTTIVGYGGESKDVVIPDMVNGIAPTTIASSAFASIGLNSVVIPDSVTTISGAAFYSNNLTSVRLPSNLKTIGASAFRENRLTSIEIPNSVTLIGNAAFVRNCFPAGQDIIYAKKSDGTWDYSTIVSGAGGKRNASYCPNGNLNLVIPATKNGVKLKKINPSAFQCCYYSTYQLPDLAQTDHLTIGSNAFYHNSFTGDSAWIYDVNNGVVNYAILASYGGARSGDLVIPGTKNGKQLKTINASFTWTSFTSITIPETVETMAGGIFGKSNRNNVNLTKLINKTGRAFDWYNLTSSSHPKPNPVNFITGTVSHQSGDVEIVDH